MKHFKILGMLAVAAAATMAFAAGASADSLSTTTGGAAATPSIHAVSEGHLTFKNPIANISCNSTTSWTPTSHGAGKDVSGPVSELNWSGCTNSWHITTISAGSTTYSAIAGTHNLTVTSNGMFLSATRLGVVCVLETKNTHMGTLTGGNPGTMHLKASVPVRTDLSSVLCGSGNFALEGGYTTTSAIYGNDN